MLTTGTVATLAQKHTFEIRNASKYFDVKIEMTGECDDYACEGPGTFSFYKKGGTKAYQVIEMANTYAAFGEGGKPLVNSTMLYDEQGVVNVDDYNFDGMEDIALRSGNEGSYGGPSYRVYLSNRAKGQFVYSRDFSELAEKLGMFDIDKKTRTLETFDKSGCCWHITERYKVVGNKPVKVYEKVEDAMGYDEKTNMRIVTITTKTLVKGRWVTKVVRKKEKD